MRDTIVSLEQYIRKKKYFRRVERNSGSGRGQRLKREPKRKLNELELVKMYES